MHKGEPTDNETELLRLECETQLNATRNVIDGPFCAGLFDGWNCWPDTAANSTAYTPCPSFILGFDTNRHAHKRCEENGSWFRHPATNKLWSNYSTCVNREGLEFHVLVNTMYEIGYSISLVALVLSLVILLYFRSLRCPRITIHMNLFASFAANNAMWILWYKFVVPHSSVLNENLLWCQVLHNLLYYFLLSNYTWMLCEGFYLHTVLISTFISESRLVKVLLLLGWGVPLLAISIYATFRSHDPDASTQCWMEESVYDRILIVPGATAMVLNVIFLCNIVRVLIVKLKQGRAMQNRNGPSNSVVQAFRATLILVPLLGLQYFLTPFRPEGPLAQPYMLLQAIISSFQGLCVAILFCFCNGEVIAQVKRKWRVVMFRPRANSCTATTVSQFVRSTAAPVPGEEHV